jgi:hypothetical protein
MEQTYDAAEKRPDGHMDSNGDRAERFDQLLGMADLHHILRYKRSSASHDCERHVLSGRDRSWHRSLVRRLVAKLCVANIENAIMDRAAIFSAVIKRNALRRANGLPPLDVRSEYIRQVELAKQRDYQTLFEYRPADREVIRQPVLMGLRTKQDDDPGEITLGPNPIGKLDDPKDGITAPEVIWVRPRPTVAERHVIDGQPCDETRASVPSTYVGTVDASLRRTSLAVVGMKAAAFCLSFGHVGTFFRLPVEPVSRAMINLGGRIHPYVARSGRFLAALCRWRGLGGR